MARQKQIIGALAVALLCGTAGGRAAAGGKGLAGTWRAVKQVELGRTSEVPSGTVVTWELRRGGVFMSTTEHAKSRHPIRAKGKWKAKAGRLSIELQGLTRVFRVRISKRELRLKEFKEGKLQREFFFERAAPCAGARRK